MADSQSMAQAANQPAGKVSTDDDVTPFTAVSRPQGEKHFDPDAQRLGPGDPNYIDPDTKGMEVPPPSGMGDAVKAAMSVLPTGMAGGVKFADTPQQSGPANATNNPSPNTKIDPGLPGTS